jgi:hydroxypyruvate isomerase
MPRFCANLMLLFQELPFLERFEAAAAVGFDAVEYQFPYAIAATDIRARLDAVGLEMVLINAPPGDWAAGERGIAALPGREDEFRASIEIALGYATVLGCPCLHVMAGVTKVANSFTENLAWAARLADGESVRILIEPLNSIDVPGYLLNNVAQAVSIIDHVGDQNLFLQYDLYHGAMSGEDLVATVRANAERIAHMQVAGVPGRNEPDTGDVDFTAAFEAIDVIGYDGWIGCEYRPATTTVEGLGWLRRHGIGD